MLNPTLQGHTSTHSHMQPAGLFSLAEENLDVEETSCFLMSQLVNENSLNLDLKGVFHSFGSLLERKNHQNLLRESWTTYPLSTSEYITLSNCFSKVQVGSESDGGGQQQQRRCVKPSLLRVAQCCCDRRSTDSEQSVHWWLPRLVDSWSI